MKNLQGIFHVYFADRDKWLYFVREPVESKAQAMSMANYLSKREGKSVIVRIEDFGDFPREDEDGFAYEVILDEDRDAVKTSRG